VDNQQLTTAFLELSTPLVADACVRVGVPLRVAPSGIRPVVAEGHMAGRALPVRHHGSVDVFLEAFGLARTGDILVIDNGGRLDEAPIGDLTALEARACGLAGITVWGGHRDTVELVRIGLPVFSYGRCPAGPQRVEPRDPEALWRARFGACMVTGDDIVFADADGVLFVPGEHVDAVVMTANHIWQQERRQALAIQAGTSLRDQLQFAEYLARRTADPAYTFRQHLRSVGGAVEE